MLCLAAHFGAAAGGSNTDLGPAAFFLQEDAHVDGANGVDDEPVVSRDSGDSDCSGPPRTPAPSPLLRCVLLRSRSHNRFGSYLRLDHQRAASPTKANSRQKDISALIYSFMAHPLVCLGFIPLLSSLQREGKGAELIVFTVQS